jgi:hypothetical protein
MLLAATVLFQLASAQPSLRGVVTDPSGAVVPNATVQVRGPADRRTRTSGSGEYSFPALPAGVYEVRVTAKGFPSLIQRGVAVGGPAVFDARLLLAIEKQTVRVDDEAGRVGVEPEANGGAVTMRARQIAALSDDPDELALQLQALAGPAPGPDGGQMFVDGFSGAAIPPKASIREIRINANPFSPEYDRPGFSRIEIFTKPGSEAFHAQAFTQFNDRALNSRNPLLTSSTRPPYRVQFYGIDLGGPVLKNRASFTLSAEHRRIGENALIQATTLDGRISEGVPAPQRRTSVAPRVDLAITPKHTVSARFQNLTSEYENEGVGNFNLPSRAYGERETTRVAQITGTAMAGPRTVNETRVQWTRTATQYAAAQTGPAIEVMGAFAAGGAPIGNSRSATTGIEVTNLTTVAKGRHTWKWGGRARGSSVEDVSVNNYAGTFLFYTLEQYRAGRPAQFLMNSGTPGLRVRQFDAGVFVSDDWKVRPALTLSLGMRYEAQTNLGGLSNFAPRVGVAWRVDTKTVVRAGAGVFYDRLASALTMNARRFDGETQRSFVVLDPPFYPTIPTLDAGPQQLRPVYAGIAAPRIYQTSVGVERQIDRASKLSVTWVASRGAHLLNARNVNTPIAGLYPFGDRSMRLLTESAGLSRIQQVVANVNATRGKVTLFGYYALSWGRDNNEGLPANPYDLRAEWGPSSYSDVRHRVAMGGGIPVAAGITLSPFVAINSGVQYNVTTGLDPTQTGYPSARPAGVGRNSGRGPSNANLGLRVARTWKFAGESNGAAPGGHGGSSRGVTIGASTLNALNTPNYAPPVGNMASPYFGQYRALGGLVVMSHGGAPTTYNRKIDLQLRLTF